MSKPSMLFSPFRLGPLALPNRIIMVPLYLAYPEQDGTAGKLVLDHYQTMAASGVGLVVVENAGVDPLGIGKTRTLLASGDRFIPELAALARTIKEEGAAAILQINHVGRYAGGPVRLAPSAVTTWGVTPQAMTEADIQTVIAGYAQAARRVMQAGFDGVELHGGTGFLLMQFLSPRTNMREDAYGGSLENRMRFALETMDAVRQAVGPHYPVGWRLMADELMPGGVTLADTAPLAKALAERGAAYLSVMAGSYDSFATPEYLARDKEEGFMSEYAGAIKRAVPGTPIIAAGRIQSPETAEMILKSGQADLIGLARVLFADPLWPKKAAGKVAGPIVPCLPGCSLCLKHVMQGKPSPCMRWGKGRIGAFGQPCAD